MVPDLTLEVIYLNEPTDFKMEFELCSSSNVRFLSLPVKSPVEFLSAISKSVIRSRAIITVGSFNPLDKLYIPKIIARATGYELQTVENEKYGILTEKDVFLPKSSLPLVDANGNLGGCILENNDQSIIMLTSERELRHNIVSNLVSPYLKLFASKKTKEFNSKVEQIVTKNAPELEGIPENTINNEVQNFTQETTEQHQNSLPATHEVSDLDLSSSKNEQEKHNNIAVNSEQAIENNILTENEVNETSPKYSVIEQPSINSNSLSLNSSIILFFSASLIF